MLYYIGYAYHIISHPFLALCNQSWKFVTLSYWRGADKNLAITITSQSYPLSHKVTRTYRIFSAHQCLLFLTLIAPIYFVMKICYKAYRWIFFYYFHTLTSPQTYATMPHDAENFRHLLHRCIVPWQKLPFLVYNQSTTTIHSLHVVCPSSKLSHFLARTNYHCFLALYFCTNLSGWVSIFSNFYYEYHYILFMKLSVAILYLICFSYHI